MPAGCRAGRPFARLVCGVFSVRSPGALKKESTGDSRTFTPCEEIKKLITCVQTLIEKETPKKTRGR